MNVLFKALINNMLRIECLSVAHFCFCEQNYFQLFFPFEANRHRSLIVTVIEIEQDHTHDKPHC